MACPGLWPVQSMSLWPTKGGEDSSQPARTKAQSCLNAVQPVMAPGWKPSCPRGKEM